MLCMRPEESQANAPAAREALGQASQSGHTWTFFDIYNGDRRLTRQGVRQWLLWTMGVAGASQAPFQYQVNGPRCGVSRCEDWC